MATRAIPSTPREPRAVERGREIHVNAVILANRNVERMDAICKGVGLTHAQYTALWVLCMADDPDAGLPIGAVADGLINRASDATRMVDRLERSGLAERLPNPDDRRGVLVRVTAEGRRVFAELTPTLQEFHRQQWSMLTVAEAEDLDRLLNKALWG